LRKQFRERGEAVEKLFLDLLEKEAVLVYLSALSGTWVSLDLAEKIFHTAAQVLYPNEEKAMQRLGYERAKDNLTGIYRAVLRISTPTFVIGQTAKLWKLYYDKGEARSFIAKHRKYAEMYVEGYPELPEIFREITTGYIISALELTGVRNIKVHRDDSNPNAWKWYGTWE